MKTLKNWYLARLRIIAARKSARTPISLVQEDKSIIQQFVLDSGKQSDEQATVLLEALRAKENPLIEQAILYILIFGGCSFLAFLAFSA